MRKGCAKGSGVQELRRSGALLSSSVGFSSESLPKYSNSSCEFICRTSMDCRSWGVSFSS